jgi:hypothetical protein
VPILAKPWHEVPKLPGLYAMYGGLWPRAWVAYVGQAGNIAQRLAQHLDRRSSSVATGTSAVGLNVDHVAYVAWWLHASFTNETHRLAAELVAFRVLDPALRSRGGIRQSAIDLSEDPAFAEDIEALLRGEPSGRYQPPALQDVADRVAELEARVKELEGLRRRAPS